jgi:hypothetical protein
MPADNVRAEIARIFDEARDRALPWSPRAPRWLAARAQPRRSPVGSA